VAFLEHGLTYHEIMEDVFHPSASLLEQNPLGRVPTVVLKNGIRLCESQVILNAFQKTYTSSLEELEVSGLMLGLCDKIVERLLESQRPEKARDPEIFTDFERLLAPTLQRGEAFVLAHSPLLGRGTLPQAAIDVGVTLAYLNLRVGAHWQSAYPGCKKFLDGLETRASFKKTLPPPPDP
jgi:glutathione S-transferase